MEVEKLGQPLIIRGIQLKNRIGLAPLGNTVYTEDGFISDESIEFYRSVARSGTALLVEGCAIVSPDARSHATQLGVWSDEQIPRLRLLTEAVHAEGGKIICQLQHGGPRSFIERPMCASAFRYETKKGEVLCREISAEEIRQAQQEFADAAMRAVKAGYDGVELHSSHGWLISSFLSSVTNHRTDEYGRDKVLFLREIFQKIRGIVPDDFIVGVRMSGYVPDLKAGLEQAVAIADMGADYISVSVNYKVKWLLQGDQVPEGYPYDPMIYAAQEMKKLVNVPVFAAKGIRTGEIAERVLEDTGVDMVLVGRGHLCDTDWARKALAGEMPNRCLECKGECNWRVGTVRCPSLQLLAKKEAEG